MIENNCKLEWRNISNSSWNPKTGDSSAKYECKKCKVWLNASEVFQLETLEHIKGFQKWLSIIATAISIVALFFSCLAFKYN